MWSARIGPGSGRQRLHEPLEITVERTCAGFARGGNGEADLGHLQSERRDDSREVQPARAREQRRQS